MPPTETCTTCHSQLWTGAPVLEPVRQSKIPPADGGQHLADPRPAAALAAMLVAWDPALKAWLLFGKALELAWLVLPAGNEALWLEAVLFAVAALGLGGLFGGFLILAFRRRVRACAPRQAKEAA